MLQKIETLATPLDPSGHQIRNTGLICAKTCCIRATSGTSWNLYHKFNPRVVGMSWGEVKLPPSSPLERIGGFAASSGGTHPFGRCVRASLAGAPSAAASVPALDPSNPPGTLPLGVPAFFPSANLGQSEEMPDVKAREMKNQTDRPAWPTSC